MHITTTVLKSAGFKHEEFPDGWFWVFKPTDAEERVKLSNILGYQQTASDFVPNTIIVQTDGTLTDWQYAYGPDYGEMSYKAVIKTLEYLTNRTK